ncbi:MAG: transglycosylase domain-containing protein [Pseudomonadota bacterium]
MKARAGAARLHAQAGRVQAYLLARPPLQRVLLPLLWVTASLTALLLLYVLLLIPFTPNTSDLLKTRASLATAIVAADGKVLASFEEGVQERVKLAQISPQVIAALIATEDHRFYEHHGIDFRRTASAILHTLGGNSQGGSTITQQLARNQYPEEIGRSRNLTRKVKELITALKIESSYSKAEILEAYLNTVPFLYNTYGIEMAARTYFAKSAAKLDIVESATLVGMLKGTNYYNPVINPERSVERRNVVLGQMRKHDAIDEKRYQALLKRPMRLHFARQAERHPRDSHFTAYVRKWLIQWADENDYNLQRDGLVVQTTLDFDLQQLALKAVERQATALQAIADVEWGSGEAMDSTAAADYAGSRDSVEPFRHFWDSHPAMSEAIVRESSAYRKAVDGGEDAKAVYKRLRADRKFITALHSAKARLEAGFVAIDPNNGELRAWVGSRDFSRDQFDHVALAARQPGSTFKPIVYGAALEKGLLPERPYRDEVKDIRAADGSVWRPTDMSGTSGRMMTMREGLVYSKNTITAQVMQDVGLPDIVKLAQNLGIRQSKLANVPSLALGTSPVTLLEMVNAYATIAAQGNYRKPIFVKRIADRSGRVLAEFAGATPERAMAAANADTLLDMMRGVIERGTGTAVRYRFGIRGDVAGKTGTTQNNTDGWFILMHPQLVAGAWVGFNDNRVTMRSSYWGQGGHNAILLVGDFFKAALDGGKLDAKAVFPGAHLALPPRVADEPADVPDEGGDMQRDGVKPPEPEQPPQPEPPNEEPEPSPPDNEHEK